MANPNVPKGFELTDSDGKQFRTQHYPKKSGSAIYRNQPVKADSSGAVTGATAGDQLAGVSMEYKASSDTTDILICDDPDAIFECMALGDFEQTNIWNHANINAGSADTSLLVDGSSIDMTTADNDASGNKQFVLLGLKVDGQNAYGSYARILVKPNYHVFRKGTTGV